MTSTKRISSELDVAKIAENIWGHPPQCSVRSSFNTGDDPLSRSERLAKKLGGLLPGVEG
jgi:hypothetical protein